MPAKWYAPPGAGRGEMKNGTAMGGKFGPPPSWNKLKDAKVPCCIHESEIDRLRAALAKALVNAAAVEQKYKAEVERLSQLAESRLQQAAVAEEQVERLRALCADRPKNTCGEFDSWLEQIDAAGRGEGRE
jgi:hypothetical protein